MATDDWIWIRFRDLGFNSFGIRFAWESIGLGFNEVEIWFQPSRIGFVQLGIRVGILFPPSGIQFFNDQGIGLGFEWFMHRLC